ncbi:hypothetical protein [Streptomyces sp. NPDC003077]|uniref:hypothetical protein n=1 Tax=Streptomyces sp. NPDC003077 TaxID=3154443 RepID=UPI0033A3C5F6
MRRRPYRALTPLVAAVGLLSGAPGTGPAAAAGPGTPPAPACGRPDSKDFPLAARLRGGPADFAPGGAWRTWYLDLRNTTQAPCRDVHPVMVLTDQRHALAPRHIRLQYRDPERRTWNPVPFESTDHDEQIGVFGKEEGGAEGGAEGRAEGGAERKEEGRTDESGTHPGKVGTGGLTVPADRTLTVPLRMRFTADAPRDRVTAGVTTVQRRAADGEWIGQSGDHTFAIRGGAPTPAPAPADTATAMRPDPAGPWPSSGRSSPGRSSAPSPRTTDPGTDPGTAPSPPQLAATGATPLYPLGYAAGALILGGAALLLLSRRLTR